MFWSWTNQWFPNRVCTLECTDSWTKLLEITVHLVQVFFPETLCFGNSLQVIWRPWTLVVSKVVSIRNAEDFLDNQKLGKKRELMEFLVCVKYALHIFPPLFLNSILRDISLSSNFNPRFQVVAELKGQAAAGGRTSICIQVIWLPLLEPWRGSEQCSQREFRGHYPLNRAIMPSLSWGAPFSMQLSGNLSCLSSGSVRMGDWVGKNWILFESFEVRPIWTKPRWFRW